MTKFTYTKEVYEQIHMDEVIVDSIRSKFQEVLWGLLQSDKALDLDIKFQGRSTFLYNSRLKSAKLILKDLDSKEIAGYIKRIELTFHSLDPFSTFVEFKEEIKRYFNFSPSLRGIVDENKIDITSINIRGQRTEITELSQLKSSELVFLDVSLLYDNIPTTTTIVIEFG